MPIQASVIVTTYNKPQALELVLYGLSKQVIAPHEIIIADDGSKNETRELVQQWASKIDTPIIHVWHEDEGNRKPLICDKAVAQAKGNHLIFLDGDSIPHSLWVHDHLQAVRDNTVLCGRRVRLGPEISQQLTLKFIEQYGLEGCSVKLIQSVLRNDTKRYPLGIRLPSLIARCLHFKERRLMGVNFSLPKELYEKAGGYPNSNDHSFSSLGRPREDAKLEIKLLSVGARRYPLLNRAIVYHIYHDKPPGNKEINDKIQTLYESALEQRRLKMDSKKD